LTFSFDPICTKPGLIVLRAELTGSTGSGVWQLALDTGATTTLINVAMLVAIGYDPALSADSGPGKKALPRHAVLNRPMF